MRALATLAAIVALSGCRAAAPVAAVKDAGDIGSTASPSGFDADAARVYDGVLAALNGKHASAKDKTWEESTADFPAWWLMQTPEGAAWDSPVAALPYGTTCAGGDDCDPDFKIKRCADDAACGSTGRCAPVLASVKKPGDEPVRMCIGGGDFVYDRIYTMLIKAQKTIDIVTLSPPDGRYRAAIENAFVYLDNAGAKPSVRMLYGGEDSTKPTLSKPVTYLNIWIDALKEKKADFALPLACAWLSHLGSWNHAKIIAVDGTDAIVGGQNFWERVYLQPDPVFDASIYVTGPAAAAATRFADTLWNSSPISTGILPTGNTIVRRHATDGDSTPGPVRIIGAGRLGIFGDDAADTAIGALFAAAKTSIRVSQQDLYRPLTTSGPFGGDELVDAIVRGVDVYVIKSSVVSKFGYGLYSSADTLDFLGRAVEKKAGKGAFLRKKGTYWRQVCDKVHFAPLRYSTQNPPDGKVKSHTKLVMVDDAAFYMGSQNIYPANLQEYGYFVFDKKLAQTMLKDYWNPAWKNSSASMIPCNPVD